MGIEFHALNLLFLARRRGVEFERTCTLGRQGIHMEPEHMRAILARLGHHLTTAEAEEIHGDGFCEPLLRRLLGATTVDSYDISNYEGASHFIDLSAAPAVDGPRYSAVLDFGTLEHCFDVATAFANAVALCEVGGHILHVSPTNNFCGHGFHQFSPETFFGIYGEARGFEVRCAFVAEEDDALNWWKVRSPIEKGGRVAFHNNVQTHILIVARKVADVPTAQLAPPQQSDYVRQAWVERPPSHYVRVTPSERDQANNRLLLRGFGPLFRRFGIAIGPRFPPLAGNGDFTKVAITDEVGSFGSGDGGRG